MKDLKIQWEQLGSISIDENDAIESEFLHFPVGTDKFTIWHWFDDNDIHGVAHLMGIK